MSYRDPLLTSDSRVSAEDRRLAAALSPRRLEVFRVTAATGSVTKAARLLDLSQPTVSQHVQALEHELGTSLFHRSGQGLSLTEFGTAFLNFAVGVLRQQEELQALLARTSGKRSPLLRLAGIPSVLHALLPGAMRKLRQDQGELSFDLKEADTMGVLECVAAGQADIGFVDLSMIEQMPDGLSTEELVQDPWYLIAAAGCTLPKLSTPELSDANEALALLSETVQLPPGSRAGQIARSWFDRMAPGHHVLARAHSYQMMQRTVGEGLGVGLAPGLALRDDALNGLRRHAVELPPRRIAAVYPARRGNRLCNALIAAVKEDRASHR